MTDYTCVSLSPGSNVSLQLVSETIILITHLSLYGRVRTLCFLSTREPVCMISLAARDLPLRFSNKYATSLTRGRETEIIILDLVTFLI